MGAAAAIEHLPSSLFSNSACSCVATQKMYRQPVWPAEESLIRKAHRRRREEFAAGRAAARSAMSDLGIPGQAILAGADGAPIWPVGIVGSISHCDLGCAAVVGFAKDFLSIGFDIEVVSGFTQELEELVLSKLEQAYTHGLTQYRRENWSAVIFSAKEALFKALYPLTNVFVDFKDVAISLAIEDGGCLGSFEFESDNRMLAKFASACRARWCVMSGVVLTGIEIRNG